VEIQRIGFIQGYTKICKKIQKALVSLRLLPENFEKDGIFNHETLNVLLTFSEIKLQAFRLSHRLFEILLA
jgi:hypothetical protein